MLRIILFLFFSTFIAQLSWGQAKQPSLGILKLNAPELEDHKAIKINKYIESAFYKSRRFNIVSRQLNESIQLEREQQKENIDNIVIEQGRAVGADYIVKGFAKLSKKQFFKSSPKSRAPMRQQQNSSSRSRTSPRTSTTTPQKKESSTNKRSAPKAKPSTSTKSTAKTSPRTSPRSSSSKNQTSRTTPKTKPTTSARDRSKSSTPKQSAAKTSPKKSAPIKQSQAPPLSTDIDQVYTSTYISFTIKIIDVKTGVIAAEENYKGSINGVTDFVNKIVKKTFPYEFKIIEVMETKGDKKAKHILLDGGTKHGIIKGKYLEAFEVSEENVDGKIFRREIAVGQLYVKKMDTGGNFSLCTIYRGKKEILKKIKEGSTIYCKLKY